MYEKTMFYPPKSKNEKRLISIVNHSVKPLEIIEALKELLTKYDKTYHGCRYNHNMVICEHDPEFRHCKCHPSAWRVWRNYP